MATTDSEKRNPNVGLDLLWGTQERPSRGPKPLLRLEEIARAGIDIADAEGLGALSMRRIAEHLGFTTMSLYRHVPSKNDLLEVMVDTAIGGALPLPPVEGDWRARLSDWAMQNLLLLLCHPWMLVAPDLQVGPHKMAWIEAGLQTLADTGLEGDEMLAIIYSVYVYTHGSAQVFSFWRQEDASAWSTNSPLMQRVANDSRFPMLRQILASGGLDDAEEDEPSESFAFGLERMLDGIAAFIDARVAERER